MMRNIVLCLVACLGCGCSVFKEKSARAAAWFEDNERIKVVGTTSMVCDLVRAVGGERVDVWCLIAGGHDPHSYELVKGDSDFLERADLVVFSGLGLEHGSSLQRAAADSAKNLVLGSYFLEVAQEQLLYDDGGALDPHIWMDISLWSQAIDPVAERLQQMDRKHAAFFADRADALRLQLQALHRECRELLMALPEERRYLVTAHDAFQYFTRAYLAEESEKKGGGWQKRLNAAEGLAPHGQVSIKDLSGVVQFIEEHHVPCIFPESYLGQTFLQKILQGLHVRARVSEKGLCADTMLEEADFNYAASMQHNARIIYEELHD